MNKILNLKTEVINLRSLLVNYKKIIPEKQKLRFDKDLNLLFENYQYLSEEKELEKMKKLAKMKLNSMIRVYGEVKETETSFDKEFLNEDQIKFNEKIINEDNKNKNSSSKDEEEYDYDHIDYNKRLQKLKNSDFFNKEKINNAQKEKDEYDELIIKAYKTVEEENNQKRIKDYMDNKNEFVKEYKEKLEDYVKNLAKQKDVSNVDSMLKGFDFEKLAEEIIKAEINSDGAKSESENSKEKIDDILQSFENILSGSKFFLKFFYFF